MLFRNTVMKTTELATRQFFSFATTTTRQRNITSGTSQGPEKNQTIVRPQCLDGVTTINIVKWQLKTTLWPDNMVTLWRQNCRKPSSTYLKKHFFTVDLTWSVWHSMLNLLSKVVLLSRSKAPTEKDFFFHLKITLKLGIVLVTFGVISKPGSSIL